MLSQVIEEEGGKQDRESGFVKTHDFLHQHAVHQLAEPVGPIVDLDDILLGGRAGSGDETDPLGGNAAQAMEKIGDCQVLCLRWPWGFSGSSSRRGSRSDDQHQVIAVDDLVIEGRAQGLAGLAGVEAADDPGVGGGVIGEAAGELVAGGVADADDVALLELADDLDDADGQQALASPIRWPAGTVVDHVMAPRTGRQADPPLAGAVRLAVGQEEGADRLAGQDPGQRARASCPRR